MSNAYETAIADIQKEIAERMKAVNVLCGLLHQKPIYPDADGADLGSPKGIRTDQWYTAGLSTAVREFLDMRKDSGPASIDDIYSALQAGGFQFESKDVPTAKAALKQSLTKNSSIFHRLPNGTYGLAAWYPSRKNNGDEQPKKAGRIHKKRLPKPDARKDATRQEEAPTASADQTPMTLLGAIKQAIAAMPVEFTKQDVLAWIQKHHPSINARRDSVFVTVTRLREPMGYAVAKEGTGQELSVYRKQDSNNGLAEHGRTKQAISA